VTALLITEGLELAYGHVPACRDITISVDEGEIVALIGANGAGKSTTLRAIAGALLPRAGDVRFAGRNITRMPSYERSKLGIALVPEGRHVFPFLTVRENLELGGFKFRNDGAKIRALIERTFAMFSALSRRASQNAGTLSGGEQQKAVICGLIFVCRSDCVPGNAPACDMVERIEQSGAMEGMMVGSGKR
jgi:branched-chain amino acid transport system ATP-binding protein